MELMGFTIDELSQIESLLQLSTNISNIMDFLYQLEIHGKKDSEEYQQQILELTRAINTENEKYQTLNLTYQQCHKYAKLLSYQTNMPFFDTKPTTSFKNYNNRVVKRIINILITQMMNNKDFHKSIIPETIINQIIKIDNKITEDDFLTSFEHSVKLQATLNGDICCIFLSILEDAIPQRKYKEYREELIKAKYCVATTNKEIEAFLLHCKFSIPKEIYTGTKLTTELLQEENKSYDIIRFAELKSKAQIEINKLLQIKDSDYNNPTTYINSIISSCYLRALLSLMKDDEINDFNQEFHDQIDSHEYLKEHLNDRIGENIIINCFKCFKYDRGRIRILSIKN